MTEQNKTEIIMASPHILSSKNHPCDKCREIVSNDNWNFPLCMCIACANDRSRWQCLGCGDNLGLGKPPYEGDFWPDKDYCDKCVDKMVTMVNDEMWSSLNCVYEMLD